MATYTADRAASTFPVFKAMGAGVLCAAYGTIELGTALAADDVIEMCRLPAGAVVLGGHVMADDLDTNATETLDIDVGWAANGTESADPDGFGNLGVWVGDAVTGIKPETGIYFPLAGKLLTDGPQSFSAETVIQFDVNAAAATGGTGTLSLVVLYIVP